MKQVLKYPGGKARIAQWIISHFPPHDTYCEPFFGSGAVFFNKAPDKIETINDIDGDVVNFFRVCREDPERLSRLISLTPWAREEYKDCYERADDAVERARRFLVRYHQSYGTCARSKNSWRNVTTYSGPNCSKEWNNLPMIIREAAARLKQAQIENCDALELIERYSHPGTLLYVDPPYPLALRERNLYRHEMTDEQHAALLQVLKKSRAKIILSSYDNALYNDELRGWATSEHTAIAQQGQIRTEKLYMNFDPPLLAMGLCGGGIEIY